MCRHSKNRCFAAGFCVLCWHVLRGCAVSSVVEHFLDTEGVRGSNPLSRTILMNASKQSIKTFAVQIHQRRPLPKMGLSKPARWPELEHAPKSHKFLTPSQNPASQLD